MSSIVDRSSEKPCAVWRALGALQVLPLLALMAWAPAALAQPANDNFANAWILVPTPGITNGSTVNATAEAGEPQHATNAAGRTVWFRWTAPTNGYATFDTTNSGFNTVLAAYSGNTIPGLIQLASNDDFGTLTSQIVFLATAGTEYRIALDGANSETGAYTLRWRQDPVSAARIEFAAGAFPANEAAGFVTVGLVASEVITEPVTVVYYTSDGTAIDGNDYSGGTNTVIFNPGDTARSFDIPINDNFFQGTNLYFNVHLSSVSPSSAAVLGSLSNAVVVIADDETPPVTSDAGSLSIVLFDFLNASIVHENEQFRAPFPDISINSPNRSVLGALVTVSRTAPASGRIMVDYYTTNAAFLLNTNLQARPIFDYTPVSGTLVFDDYQMMANFIVPIQPGTLGTNETFRYFDVVIHNARPAPEEDPLAIAPNIALGRAQVQINKINGPANAFAIERRHYRADEYANFARGGSNVVNGIYELDVDVILPGGGPGLVDFLIDVGAYSFLLHPASDYADDATRVWDSTLHTDGAPPITNVVDYVLASGGTEVRVAFGNGQTRRTITIRMSAEDVVEFNEDIRIRLRAVPNNPPVNPRGALASATILFDDQPAGAADREWNPEGVIYTIPRFYTTPGADSVVSAVVVQPDNKTVIGGGFTHYNSVARNRIARIKSDGSNDDTFNPGGGADGGVASVVLYPTNSPNFGKILIGGAFTSFDSARRNGIARLNANGSLDPSFAPGNGANGIVRAIAVQNDGKIVVAGGFTTFNDINFNGLVRLNADGSVDSEFNPGLNPFFGPNGAIWSVVVHESGTNRVIYVGGEFTTFSDQPRSYLARLLDDGTVDPSFDPGRGADGPVYAMALQQDAKLLIGGSFNMYHTFQRSSLARINPDGSLDESYGVGTGADDAVYAIAIQPDGKAVIGGIFNSYNGTRRMGLARLFTTGALDTSFMDTAYNHFAGLPRTFAFDEPSYINSLALDTNGHVMIGGSFTNIGGNLSIHHPIAPTNYFPFYHAPINGRTNGHNSGAHPSAPFTRQDKTVRFNVAKILGGYTPGPGSIEIDPASQPFSINEDSRQIAVTMRRVDGRLGTVGATLSTTDNTAVSPTDFSSSASEQLWPQWLADINAVGPFVSPHSVGYVRRTYFDVPINDDGIQEGDETFYLSVSNAFGEILLGGETIPLGAAFGALSQSAAVIADDDFSYGVFNFKFRNYVTNENGLFAVVSVIRTNGSQDSVTVDYYTRTNLPHSSATSGVDYTSIRGTLVFGNTETEKTFAVPILDNPEVEQDEIVSLVLTNATGGAALHGNATFIAATLTIVDNDFLPGRLQFSSATYTNAESDAFTLVTVTRTGGTLGAMTVTAQTVSGGSATPGVDYTSVITNLTWAHGDSTSRTFAVPLLPDGQIEGQESIQLRLSNPTLAGSFGSQSNAVIWINDADAYGVLSFNQGSYQADENGIHPTITVFRSAGSAGTVSVNFSTQPLTAVAGVDYIPTNGTLVFTNGEFSKSFQVHLLDNTIPDGDRTVQLTLSSPVNATLGAFSDVVLTIVDNESINLPAGSLDTTFNAQAAANAAVYALVQQQDGRIIMAGDFTFVNDVPRNRLARLNVNGTLDQTFDIGPGANNSIRALGLQSDGRLVIGGLFNSVNGTNRNAVARLSTDGKLDSFFNPGSGADNGVFALTIQPDDKILLGGSFSSFNGQTRPGLVRLNQHGAVDPSFAIGAGFNGIVYSVAVQNDGKVLVGGDFISFNGTPRTNFVRLLPNGALDTSFANLAVSAPVRAILVDPDGKIVIGGSFTNVGGFARAYLARLEKNGAVDLTFLDGLSGADNTVYAIKQQIDGKLVVAGDFRTFNGVTRNGITRLNAEDGSTDPTINFGAGVNGFVAALVIQPDRRIVLGGGFSEYDGLPRQNIARIYGGSMFNQGSIEFSRPEFVVSEQGTNAIVAVRRIGGTLGSVSVDYQTFDGSAIAGLDYLPASGSLSFPQGETRQYFSIPILGNNVLDGDRELYLLLSNFGGGAAQGPQPFALVRIQDDESAIGFSVPYYSVSEAPVSGFATVAIVRRGNTNSLVSASVTSADGTATGGLDYVATNTTFTLMPGERFKNFRVRILNDTLIEGNETLSLALANPSGFTSLDISNATVTIMDDDANAGSFLFSTNNYVVDEFGGQAVVTVLRTNGSQGIVTVTLATADATAMNGADYIGTNRVLTFADGETAKSLAFPILNDSLPEADEIILLTLSNPTGGTQIISSNSIVTISDEETPSSIGFQTNNFVFAENGGFAVVSVVRSGNRSGAVSVDLSMTPGTATPGVDYQPVSTTVSFTPNEVLRSVLVPLFDDIAGETPETVNLFLGNLQSGTPASLGLATSTLTIVDNDTTVRFASASFVALENQTNAVITVVRGGNSQTAMSVDYRTVPGGTAFEGVHYLGVSGTLSWLAGDGAPKTFSIPVIDNTGVNGGLTVLLALTNVTGLSAFIDSPSNAVLTIVDNELGNPVSGVVDPTFNGNIGANAGVRSVAFDSNQRLIVGGDFTLVHGYPVSRITRMTTNGAVDVRFDVGTGADNTVYSVAAQSNLVYLAGAFTNVNGTFRAGIARLLESGAIDTSFDPGNGANAAVYAVTPFGSGAIIGGDFTLYGGNAAVRIARITTNGTIDGTFNTSVGANGAVRAVAVQPNGQVLIGGDFSAVNGFVASRIARLNFDGSFDTSFNIGLGADATVRSIVVQPDGKIVIGGDFQTINGSPRAHVARLNNDGVVDLSFNPGFGASSSVHSVALQGDGRIIVGGTFNSFDGNPFRGIARLNQDGSLDTFFAVGTGADGAVNSVATYTIPAPIVCEPPVIAFLTFDSLDATNFTGISNYVENCVNFFGPAGGVFHAVSNTVSGGTAAQILSSDGALLEINTGGRPFSLFSINFLNLSGPVIVTSSLGGRTIVSQSGQIFFDSTFTDVLWVRLEVVNGAATIDNVLLFSSPGPTLLPTDRIALGGDFHNVNGVPKNGIALLDFNGAVDQTFDPGAIATHSVYAIDTFTNTAVPSVFGKVLAGGDFLALVGAEGVSYVGRLNIDGSIDKTFHTGVGPNGTVRAVVAQPDGKAIIGGFFTSYDFLPRSHFARINVDGSLDNTFNPGVGVDNGILAMALQPDGKIVIGGAFTHIYGSPRSFIGRVLANGTVDTNFVSSADGLVRAVALQSDGKVLIAGDFTTVNGTPRGGIARLNANGTLDVSFAPAAANASVNAIAVTASGQVLVGGVFTQIGGNAAPRFARLNANGSFDSSFAIGGGASDYVSAIKLQPDGKILVGGNFGTFNGQVRNRLVRLNSDGSFDPSINFGTGANNFISTIALQSYDSKILVGGGFTRFDDEVRVGIARLFNGDNTGNGVFEFAVSSYAVNERSNTVTLAVVRGGGTFGTVTVSYSTANGTAVAGTDYTASSGTLTFGEAENVKYITVPIIDNTVTNIERSFTVTLSSPTGGATLGALSSTTVSILDNDSVVAFSTAAYTVNEAAGAARITVVRYGGVLDAATVEYATLSNGTATAGVDFNDRRATLIFNPGVRVQSFDVPIIDDTLSEFNETVPLTLFNPSGTALGLANATLTIVENEFSAGVITLATNTYSVSEDGTSITINVYRTNGFTGVATVAFQTGTNLSATAGLDFIPTNGVLTFNDGQTNASFTVRILDDTIIEGNEGVPIQLYAVTGGASLGISSATLLIIDNDAPGQFVFTQPEYIVSESGTVALVTVLRTNGNLGNVSVQFQTSGGTATPVADYTAVTATLTFNVGQNARTVQIPIVNDALIEGTETIGLILSNPTGGTTIGTPSSILSVIDDEVSVSFATNSYAAVEGFTNVAITVFRIGDTNIAFSIGVTTSDATATAFNDYIPLLATLNFSPGETNKTFLVSLVEDVLPEGTEFLNLSFINPGPGVLTGPISTAELAIIDDDISFSYSAAVYNVGENSNTVVVTVFRQGDPAPSVSVEYGTLNGTATGGFGFGSDFLTATGRLLFASGVATQSFTVTIFNDFVVEGNETVNLYLANPSAGSFLGPQANAIINILDDDTSIAFSSTNYIVNEKATNAVITVTRTGIATAAASVVFRTTNGTALAGVDYAAVTQTINWLANDTAPRTVLVPIVDDGQLDGPETVRLVLDTPVGATVDPFAGNSLLTITDVGGAIAFASSSYSVVERDGNALLTLVRTGGTNGNVTVNWSVLGGTAINGQDFFGASGTVLFPHGETTRSIILPVAADGLVEGIESVTIGLSDATGGARVGSPSTALLRIIDGDTGVIVPAGAALVAESVNTNNIIESNELVSVLLALRNAGVLNDDITATLVYTNGTSVSPTNAAAATNLQQQSYGTLFAGGAAVSRPFTFRATGSNGSRLTITLLLTNSAGVFLGDVTFPYTIGRQIVPFGNANVITVPDVGPATPFPATITVSGVGGPLNKLTVTLFNVSHDYPDDLDIMLVAPNGRQITLMSDAGLGGPLTPNALNNVTLTFDDDAQFQVPDSGVITSGSYRTANWGVQTDPFPAGGPVPPYSTNLSTFNGMNPNGVWSLFIHDDSPQNGGTIAGGWSLNIQTAEPVISGADLAVTVTDSPDPVLVNGTLTYTIAVANNGPAAASFVTVTNIIPNGTIFQGSFPARGGFGNTVILDFGTLPIGGVATGTITVTAPNVPGTINFEAHAGSGVLDLNPGNNFASTKTSVSDPSTLPVPVLFSARKGTNIVLSWQHEPGTVLQAKTLMSAEWGNAVVEPVISNGVGSVTIPLSTGSSFFRLKRQ